MAATSRWSGCRAISNATDAEALATEPGVRVRFTIEPAEIAAADLVVLPGSKSTVDDLAWLRETGLADAVRSTRTRRAGKPLLGICGGFQMLARAIHDDVESRRGTVSGLGLLPVEITFEPRKTVRASRVGRRTAAPVSGYEIHHGYVSRDATREPLITYADGRTRAPGTATSSARTGTARSSPTSSAGGSSRTRRASPAGTASGSARTPASRRPVSGHSTCSATSSRNISTQMRSGN